MKLISLNTWGGKIFEPLMEFIKGVGPEIDIFCFQELFFGNKPGNDVGGARANLAEELHKVLGDFNVYPFLAPNGSVFINETASSPIGQAIFLKKEIGVIDKGGFYTFSPITNHSGIFQYIKIKLSDGEAIIGNLHGLWQAGGKRDTPERLEQSRIIKEFYNSQSCKKILCGDFNLRPETKSIAMLEENLKNLIKTYSIKSTRSHFYKDADKYRDHLADYVFVSPDVRVSKLHVLNVPISDHLPIAVEFS